MLTHHRSCCDDCRPIDRAGGRHDADAGMSGHDDIRIGGCEAGAGLDGHHRQLHDRTVQGFDQIGFFGELINYPVKITAWNDVTVVFKGSANFANSTDSIMGHIDRVTGDVAGVLEDGVVTVSDRGTGQGSVISPLLANVYLHYVFDLWAERWRHRPSRSGRS